jgi:23S rRNA pseudouridine1911/1915/1917 synthase
LRIQKNLTIQVPKGQKKIRIDKYLSEHVENASRTKVQKAIESGFVVVNTKTIKSNYQVQPFDLIDVNLPHSEENTDVNPENISLDIIFEDEFLLIVNKPPGMVTHPAYKNYSGTLVNALMFYVQNKPKTLKEILSELNGTERAGIVHRLDKETSGLLVVAKNEEVHRRLSNLFSKHQIIREYWALVWGKFNKKTGIIEKALGRSNKDRKKVIVREDGKMAVTIYEVIEEFDFLTLIKLNLKTGRTHQIRVHMHSIGHPVFGDPAYEGRKPHGVQLTNSTKNEFKILLDMITRQCLHAKVLGFLHPVTKENMYFDSTLPADFNNLLSCLRTSKTII